jgi:hypothetical protein
VGTRSGRSNTTKGALLIGAVFCAALFAWLLGVTGSGDDVESGADHPCEILLMELRPPLLGLVATGGGVPACRTGRTEPPECWGPLAGSWIDDLQSLGLHIDLSPTDEGFDLNCRADLDADGEMAMFRTTEEVLPLALSGESVR